MAVARRIVILGPSGPGKSTLARRIGERVGVPVVHLEALTGTPGGCLLKSGNFATGWRRPAARDTWIMDGNYSAFWSASTEGRRYHLARLAAQHLCSAFSVAIGPKEWTHTGRLRKDFGACAFYWSGGQTAKPEMGYFETKS